MKVFIPARHGIGDLIHLYFINSAGRKLLIDLFQLYSRGEVTEVLLFHEDFMTSKESMKSIFGNLPFPVTVLSTAEAHERFPEILISTGNNEFPEQVGDYINLLFLNKHILPIINVPELHLSIPTLLPDYNYPDNFILCMPYAGVKDRCLMDSEIYNAVKSVTNLPIIITGMRTKRNENFESRIKGDIDLMDKLQLTEVLYLASKAKLIIAGLSFMRTCSALFGTPVIELYEGNDDLTLKRTAAEYERGFYGMKPDLNFWYLWDQEKENFINKVKEILGGKLC